MGNFIPIEVKKECCKMFEEGIPQLQIYRDYFEPRFTDSPTYESFKRMLRKWRNKTFPDNTTLEGGTYEGFVAHGATVQVSGNGEIVQAWIKQKVDDINPEEFIEAIRGNVEPYKYKKRNLNNTSRMLEIPLFDMHWGIAFMDYYDSVLKEILDLIYSHSWDKIVIPFGQDFFHNDSIVNNQTTKGTVIEKVDMTRAIKEGQQFMYAIIDAAIFNSNAVKVIYTAGNHDRSISWMFIQVLLERYGPLVVDDSLDYRKVISYGKNSIMVTHGDSKQATPRNLANIFPISFAEEFANADVREVHAGHLHREGEADIYGVMIRRLSSGSQIDEWANKEDFIGAHKRFMVFDWDLDKLKSIHYI